MTRLILTSLAVAAMLAATAGSPLTAGELKFQQRTSEIGLLLPAIQKVRESAARRSQSTLPSSSLRARPGLNRRPDGASNSMMLGEQQR